MVSGVIVGILLSYFVYWLSRRRYLRNKNPQPRTTRRKTQTNSEAETIEDDSTYQELDPTKMNKEDNYQSLIVRENTATNDAGNNDDSAYSELTRVRDVEDNYQSLT